MLSLVIQLGNIVAGTIIAKEIIEKFKIYYEGKNLEKRFKIDWYYVFIARTMKINKKVKIIKKV